MEGRGNYSNYGRGSGGRGRGRGRGRDQQDQNYRGRGGGGEGGRGRGRGNMPYGGEQHNQQRGGGVDRGPHMDTGGYGNRSAGAGGGGGGGEGGRGRGSYVGGGHGSMPHGGGGGPTGGGVWTGRRWGPSSSPSESIGQPLQQLGGGGGGGGVGPTGGGVWTGRRWGPSSSPSPSIDQPLPLQSQPDETSNQSALAAPDSVEQLSVESLRISESKSLSFGEKSDSKKMPMRRPDKGTLSVRRINLLANHFPVRFNTRGSIIHYDVDVKQVMPNGNRPLRRSIPKEVMHSIREKLFADESVEFPVDKVAYDGEKNIFSAVELPTGEFRVELSDGEDTTPRTYIFTIKAVSQLKLSKLKDYLCGNLPYIPRDILQAMDLVMKENPSKNRIPVGRGFYPQNYRQGDDLGNGIAAYRGFQQSLKPTSQGLALCLDYSVLAFRKPLLVLDFLKECIKELRGVDDIPRMSKQVLSVLKGLKVRVTHRKTKQKYTISKLTTKPTRDVTFDRVDPDGHAPPTTINIVDYFWEKYKKRITHLNIPCLDLGNEKKINYVPMEFCVLLEGQRYPKEDLDRDAAMFLKKISLPFPTERKSTICEMVQAEDGPYGSVAKNFEMEIVKNMTSVEGRVLGAPELKLGAANGNVSPVIVDPEKCQWNLVNNSVVEGKALERWALIDFTSTSQFKRLVNREGFINNLRRRSQRLGMHMEYPLTWYATGMHEFSSVTRIDGLLKKVIADAGTRLQLIVCVMTDKHPGYKYLKWVSETKIGVVTQCCLSFHANKGQDQYLANLCLKINAKIGGSNVELNERLPNFVDEDYVMFIGADVNHPAAHNYTCPSIAAVVGTINWPAANKYAARIQPQEHRKEKIVNFGIICRDLVNTYAQHNKVKPKKIIVFRDGVSDGQFDMVLNEELIDLKLAIYDDHYQPTITLVVAQKRHQTRLFPDGRRDRGVSANVPPGTVVDTKIVHPFEFDFYLCSHYGSLGTSKPTHYYVLWDENAFTSDKLQKLIYNLCFTYARCTKPVSLVPPVYYADLVAYRGRLFQEVVMEQPPASSVSSSSATASTSAAASLNQSFYTSHPDLKNVMSFV